MFEAKLTCRRSNPPYTCPFPNCSRQFDVNSNMRHHYRTHFTPGVFDLTELSYSTVDEWFYPMAVNNASPTSLTNTAGHRTRGRCNTGLYIPPMSPVSYGTSFSPPPTLQSYPPLCSPTNLGSCPNCPAPYVAPTTAHHDQHSRLYSTRDQLQSLPHNNKLFWRPKTMLVMRI